MTPVWIVSFGYGTKLAFESLEKATQYVALVGQATMVDSVYLNQETYYKADEARISIMQGTFISKEEEEKLKDLSDI